MRGLFHVIEMLRNSKINERNDQKKVEMSRKVVRLRKSQIVELSKQK